MVPSQESRHIVDNNGKYIPCKRQAYYESDVTNSYGVCKSVVLPILVKAALASTATVHQVNSGKDPKGKDEEEPDDSLLYAVVVGIFYAFVMVFLILANLHPSKSLLADLERYESLIEAREQKFNARMLARFIKSTEDANKDYVTSNQDRMRTDTFHFAKTGEKGNTTDDRTRNSPHHEYRTYDPPIRNFKAVNIQI